MSYEEIEKRFPLAINYMLERYGEMGLTKGVLLSIVQAGVEKFGMKPNESLLFTMQAFADDSGKEDWLNLQMAAELMEKSEDEVWEIMREKGVGVSIAPAPWLKDFLENR